MNRVRREGSQPEAIKDVTASSGASCAADLANDGGSVAHPPSERPSIKEHGSEQPATDGNLPADQPIHVVGIGASAGGLEALESFFDSTPADTGMAFVVIQHLSPDFRTMMVELLSRHTAMPVVSAEDGMLLQANHVYLIPPAKVMTVNGTRLSLSAKDVTHSVAKLIDLFFESLAREVGPLSVGIILSGTGSDGSRGVEVVHEVGGLVMVQTPSSAKFDGMPKNVLAKGVADISLAADQMGRFLVRYLNSPLNEAVQQTNAEVPCNETIGIERIFQILADRHGVEFTAYIPTTLAHRIERRLKLLELDSIEDYVVYVEADPAELDALFDDLLIGVTRFFRDSDSFSRLETVVIPKLFVDGNPQEIRVWAAGCATGQEAYSLAILLHEHAERIEYRGEIKLFASDINCQALERAAGGIYSEEQVADISSTRLEHYFTAVNGEYHISAEIRKMVVFANHNLLTDAPFTRLDLVLCRNMLIYLKKEQSQQLLATFHYSLKQHGFLMLGNSEGLGSLEHEFETIDGRARIYRKLNDVPLLREISALPRSLRRTERHLKDLAKSSGETIKESSKSQQEIIAAYEQLAVEYVPPTVLIDSSFRVLHTTAGVMRFIRTNDPPVGRNLLEQLDPRLRSVVAQSIQRASKERRIAVEETIWVQLPEEQIPLTVAARRMTFPKSHRSGYLITFKSGSSEIAKIAGGSHEAAGQGKAAEKSESDEAGNNSSSSDMDNVLTIARLKTQLRLLESELHDTSLKKETSDEELKATNAELSAANEELQSTNEELHSVNEELFTVNSEHQRKINELTVLTEDMENLLSCTEVATIFLDAMLHIRRFTPGIAELFKIEKEDIGRAISSFNHSLIYDDLIDDLHSILKGTDRIEREIRDQQGTPYLVRMFKYRSHTESAGVVISLIDLSLLESARQELRTSEARFRSTFDNAAVGIAHVGLDGSWLKVNQRLCEIVQYSEEELLETDFQHITYPNDLQADVKKFEQLIAGTKTSYAVQKRYIRKDGSTVWVNLTVSLQHDEDQKALYAIAVIQDISQRKKYERELTNGVKQRDRFLALLSHELRNPLAAVLNAARLIERLECNETLQRPHDIIKRQSEQMSHLLDDLLDVARITQNKIMLNKSVIDLRSIITEAVDAVQPLMEQFEHGLVVSVGNHALPVDADRTRILQVVENLLTNAAKYTPPGGIIELTAEQIDEHAILSVVDNGRGMHPEQLRQVFDMFVQSEEGLGQRQGGMGLGLTLVKSLVELHGGTVSATSAGAGRGSCFEVMLPITPKELLQAQDSEEFTPPACQRIVLVEDEADAREMLTDLLELDGHTVWPAEDGEKGVQAILEHRPDIALVDIALPGISGHEVAKEVRKTVSSEEVCLVALTGFGRPSDRKAVLKAGFDEHLVKPVRTEELERVLHLSEQKHLPAKNKT